MSPGYCKGDRKGVSVMEEGQHENGKNITGHRQHRGRFFLWNEFFSFPVSLLGTVHMIQSEIWLKNTILCTFTLEYTLVNNLGIPLLIRYAYDCMIALWSMQQRRQASSAFYFCPPSTPVMLPNDNWFSTWLLFKILFVSSFALLRLDRRWNKRKVNTPKNSGSFLKDTKDTFI